MSMSFEVLELLRQLNIIIHENGGHDILRRAMKNALSAAHYSGSKVKLTDDQVARVRTRYSESNRRMNKKYGLRL